MKKIFSTIVFVLLCGNLLQAQVHYGVEVNGGFDAIEASNVECKSPFTLRAGAFIRYNSDLFGAGIYYGHRSFTLSEFIPQYAPDIQKLALSTNFIELVPIMVNLNFAKFTNWKANLLMGLYGAYHFAGKATLTDLSGNNRQIDNIFHDQTDFKAFQPWDYGAKLGVELNYRHWLFGVILTEGFPNLSPYDKRMKTHLGEFSVGYQF